MVGHAQRRNEIISRIVKTLQTIEERGIWEEINWKEFRTQICAEYGCSWRTAGEYLKVGQMKYGKFGAR